MDCYRLDRIHLNTRDDWTGGEVISITVKPVTGGRDPTYLKAID